MNEKQISQIEALLKLHFIAYDESYGYLFAIKNQHRYILIDLNNQIIASYQAVDDYEYDWLKPMFPNQDNLQTWCLNDVQIRQLHGIVLKLFKWYLVRFVTYAVKKGDDNCATRTQSL